jgi:hypothetical protein
LLSVVVDLLMRQGLVAVADWNLVCLRFDHW